jgi:hypothetical protein
VDTSFLPNDAGQVFITHCILSTFMGVVREMHVKTH